VGTEMITAKPVAALSGVYKLVEDNMGPKIKLSEDKRTYPGIKQVYRVENKEGKYLYDVLELEGMPHEGKPLLEYAVKRGEKLREAVPLNAIREYSLDCVVRLPDRVKKVQVSEPYELRIGPELLRQTEELVAKYSHIN